MVLVDQGCLTDILFYSTFEKMQLIEASLTTCKGDLVGYFEERVDVCGAIWLRTTFNSQPKAKAIDVQYLIINMILGRSSLNTLGVIVSTPHLADKNKQSTETSEANSVRDMRSNPPHPLKRSPNTIKSSINLKKSTPPKAQFLYYSNKIIFLAFLSMNDKEIIKAISLL
ncbi:hypothetical protein Cni_G13817 [Canna indica]|uniref:Uncharacterized protein n=1 Tax=Canna indica TaxID=4628 RepID=A0AAQ3KAL0_9LILI|nr:hypothetical protein Cni_G13817 [Canna indica]